jgi:hypothetical protein
LIRKLIDARELGGVELSLAGETLDGALRPCYQGPSHGVAGAPQEIQRSVEEATRH